MNLPQHQNKDNDRHIRQNRHHYQNNMMIAPPKKSKTK